MTEKAISSSRVVGPAEWLEALKDPACKLPVILHGFVHRDYWGPFTERTLPDHLIYFVVEGALEMRVAGELMRLEAGTFFWLAPDIIHDLRMSPQTESALYFLRFRLVREMGLRLVDDFLRLENAWEFRPFLQQVVDDLNSKLPYYEERARAGLTLLSTSAFRQATARSDQGNTFNSVQRQHLLRYLEERAGARLSAVDLALELHLSPDYFARVFRRTFGLSPRAWIKRERMRLATYKLLESDCNISEIARQLGYDDIYLFSHQFKEVFGCSPTIYRKRH